MAAGLGEAEGSHDLSARVCWSLLVSISHDLSVTVVIQSRGLIGERRLEVASQAR
jgi:hypothetical protein